MSIHTVALETAAQRLYLLPGMGGSVAAWDWKTGHQWTPLFRPWDGQSDDRYTLACFPLVPWSNRITHGGFEQDGVFHPIAPNRPDEAYPIHGDGWRQAWTIAGDNGSSITLALESHRFDGNPYEYRCAQTFRLLPDGLAIELEVTHLGDTPLPYGLGLHPYFERNEQTRLLARTTGVWLSGGDPIPTAHTHVFPPTWDYNAPAPLPQDGPLIDNCFSGWDGTARIDYPDRGMTLTMTMEDCKGYSLMYRPPEQAFFCYEPITQPIDAFHMPDRPGLVELAKGQSMALRVRFEIRQR
jgi:aldose 1-epimerase